MERRYRQVMSELLDAVVTGELAAETWLPGVDAIAARHACSAGAAREAVRALEERGVLDVVPGLGQRVLADDRWDLLDADVVTALLVEHPARPLLAEAVEAFRLAETQAALLAARRAQPGDVRMLAATVGRMREEPAEEPELHRMLALVSGNRVRAAMLETLAPALVAARRRRAPDRDGPAARALVRLVPALRESDPTAAAAAVDDYGRRLAGWLGV
jgi:GntR family transcriptional repressor for pyruvate dehydrogenase complex